MQERANPSNAQDLLVSPIKEKRLGRFSPLDFSYDFEQCAEIRPRLLSQRGTVFDDEPFPRRVESVILPL